MSFLRNEFSKISFENSFFFIKSIYKSHDDVIYKEDSYLRSNKELKIEAKNLRLTLVEFLEIFVSSDSVGVNG